ncbi:MAG: hypothetical protein CO096_27700 [Armatimonadetes bacterium CG_4_9_14_3_um_filter_66_14]|nr:hypothetical protein [Armatimonadota bacterium]PJB61741.1 MAG: hypothetical protein CO096_27700 [Armatimonadetes bacterium CG_4_9_14_3_um_filter_66_14]
MWHTRTPFRKSDLIFGIAVWTVVWLAACYQVGARRYALRAELREVMRIEGVVKMPPSLGGAVDTVRFESEAEGGYSGLCTALGLLDASAAGAIRYGLGVPAATGSSGTSDGKWPAPEPARSHTPMRISIQVPAGWTVDPAYRIVTSSNHAVDFEVRRRR